MSGTSRSHISRIAVIAVIALSVLSAACGSSSGPPPIVDTATPVPTWTAVPQTPGASVVDPTPTQVQFSTPTPTPTPSLQEDPVVTMSKIFQGVMATLDQPRSPSARRITEGFLEAQKNLDKSQAPVIVEVYRFLPSQEHMDEAGKALAALTGQSFGSTFEAWGDWAGYVGEHAEEFTPPNGYVQLKRRLLARIDPRYEDLLATAHETSRVDMVEVLWAGNLPDDVAPLESPPHLTADAADYLLPDDRVIGVSINGEHRAYPLRIMNAHEIANDTLGGEPVTIAYSVLSGAPIAYSPMVDAEATTFGASGLLYLSNNLLYDRKTLSLWTQATGRPVTGPQALNEDLRLSSFPTVVTTWEEWHADHPDTTVIDVATGIYDPGLYYPEGDARSIYYDYRASPDLLLPVWPESEALQPKAAIIGVDLDGQSKAYPVDVVQTGRVINDMVGAAPVVVVGSAGTQAARVYHRGDRAFSLPEGADDDSPAELMDDAGATWTVTEDALVNASNSSDRLERIPAHPSSWFGWYAFRPDTAVFGQ